MGGILDLRLAGRAWIDVDEDRALAHALIDSGETAAERLAFAVFSRRPDWSRERAAAYARQVVLSAGHVGEDVDGWLAPAFRTPGLVLDLGCGPGGFLAAAAARGHAIAGIDVSLAWLVVARALLAEQGAAPPLAAAFGEALPLRDDAASAVVSLDVIEHVADRASFVGEVHRVLRGGGAFLLSTPNRYSLGAEPHVGVWGVGWLPRRWQRQFAEWRSGRRYVSTWLFGRRELTRTIASGGRFHAVVDTPPLPARSLAGFGARRAKLGSLYNRLIRFPWFRHISLYVGPFFRVTAFKRSLHSSPS